MNPLLALTLVALGIAIGAMPLNRAEAADAELLRRVVEEAGGKILFSAAGEPVQIDLYNGNNPMKGKGGRNMAVNDAWLEHLAGATSLTALRLTNCDVHGPGLEHIAGLTKLDNLDLTLTPVTDEHFVHLAALELDLLDKQATDEAVAFAAAVPTLRRLGISYGPAITDAAVDSLLRSPAVEEVQLGQTKITDTGLMRLAGLKSLKRLRLTRSPQAKSQTWTDAAIEHLQKTRPDLELDVK